jgi:hypothetical protein
MTKVVGDRWINEDNSGNEVSASVLCCCNRIAKTGLFIEERNFFLMALKAGKSNVKVPAVDDSC